MSCAVDSFERFMIKKFLDLIFVSFMGRHWIKYFDGALFLFNPVLLLGHVRVVFVVIERNGLTSVPRMCLVRVGVALCVSTRDSQKYFDQSVA